MKLRTRKFDPAKYLDDADEMATYLTEALQTGDSAFIADALGVLSRARGMTKIAKKTGLTRESLYKALSAQGNPELQTVLKVLRALGLSLSAKTGKAA
jgi:probable addiction module antidote protein